jgi:hypothetical protein
MAAPDRSKEIELPGRGVARDEHELRVLQATILRAGARDTATLIAAQRPAPAASTGRR